MASEFYVVENRAYPVDIRMSREIKEPVEFTLFFNGESFDFVLKEISFKTFVYNSMKSFFVEVDHQKLKKIMGSRGGLDELNSEEILRIYFLQNGTVLTQHIYNSKENLLGNELEDILRIGSDLFNLNTNNDSFVYHLIKSLSDIDVLGLSKVSPFGIINFQNEECFTKEAPWRAWASTNFVEVSAQKKNISETENDCISLNGNTVEFIISGYFSWSISRPFDASSLFDAIWNALEPASVALSIRSNCANAKHNMMNICRDFSEGKAPTLSPLDLRRYISSFQSKIHEDRLYEESSEKSSRQVYYRCFDDLNLNDVLGGVSEIIDTSKLAIEGLQSERSDKISITLNLIALTFTCLALISVIADVVGFVDFKGLLFDIEPRLLILGSGLLFILLTLILTRRKITQDSDQLF